MIVKSKSLGNNNREQISNKQHLAMRVFEQVEDLLKKDEYSIFKLRQAKSIDAQIKKHNAEIERLIEVNSKSKSQIDSMTEETNNLRNHNLQMINQIQTELGV